MDYSKVTEDYAVAAQIAAADVADIAASGFAAIICNRPDNEEPGQPPAIEIRAACEQAGIAFHHIPFAGAPPSADLVAAHRQAIDDSAGPVLGYCRSGQRSLLIWQM
ncbi:MAG: TIGR01244 family sulfur transferase [Woeseiaceae bacterium]